MRRHGILSALLIGLACATGPAAAQERSLKALTDAVDHAKRLLE